MDTLEEMREALQSDLNVGNESTLFSPDKLDATLNRAYRKAGGLFLWPETEDAKKTSTQSGWEYYDYPTTWRPDSIWRLEIDGKMYGEEPDGSPLAFPDYLKFKEDNPTSTDKKWSSQWRRYFIWPVPTTNGDNNIVVWGQKVVEKMTDNSSITIFSYSLPECNEAVILEAKAILEASQSDDQSGAFRSAEAKQILATAWGKIQRGKMKIEKTQPMLYVPDFFGRGGTKNTTNGSPIGNFD